jgi:hypothetical protein
MLQIVDSEPTRMPRSRSISDLGQRDAGLGRPQLVQQGCVLVEHWLAVAAIRAV